jgi:hypothetical protein
MFKGAIIGFFRIRRKSTGRQLAFGPVITDTGAAVSLPGATGIGAGAGFSIFRLIAGHKYSLFTIFPCPAFF